MCVNENDFLKHIRHFLLLGSRLDLIRFSRPGSQPIEKVQNQEVEKFLCREKFKSEMMIIIHD